MKKEKRIPPHEIIYLRADSNYTHVFLSNGEHRLVCSTLKTFEHRYINLGFFRIHKSSIINLDFVKNYTPCNRGGRIELANNQIIKVSRRKNSALRTLLLTNP
jgi:two-component system, LytTR family, response regulator